MSNAVRRAARPGGKWFLIFSIGLVAFVSGLNACSDTPANSVAPHNATAAAAHDRGTDRNQYSFVGEGHNAMVDAVLRDVSKKKSKGLTRKDLCKLVEEAAISYARRNASNPSEAMSLVKKQDFCAASNASGTKKLLGARLSIADGYGLSGRAAELLNSIDYLISVSYSAGQLQSYLGSINSAAQTDLNSEESQIVLSASSVAASSFDYWSANLGYWQTQLATGQPAYSRSEDLGYDARMTPRYSFWGSVWDVARADLEGAIGGGVAARLAKAAIPEAALWSGGARSLIKVINLM